MFIHSLAQNITIITPYYIQHFQLHKTILRRHEADVPSYWPFPELRLCGTVFWRQALWDLAGDALRRSVDAGIHQL